MSNNLWGNIDNIDSTLHTTDNINNILQEQSASLKEQTGDIIKGRFKRIKTITVSTNPYKGLIPSVQTMKELSEAFNSLPIKRKEVMDDFENENLADANMLYCKNRYGYEIYTNTYKFRIFELTLDPVYPITVSIDEGIVEECVYDLQSRYFKIKDNNIEIHSDKEFITLLSIILKSKKILFIISNLLQKNQISTDNQR